MRRDQTAWNIISRLIPGTVVVGKSVSLMVVDHINGKGKNTRGYVDLDRGRFHTMLTGLIRSNEDILVLPSVREIPASRSQDKRMINQRVTSHKDLAVFPDRPTRKVRAVKRVKPQWGLTNKIVEVVAQAPSTGLTATQIVHRMQLTGYVFNTKTPLASVTGLLSTLVRKGRVGREQIKGVYHYKPFAA